MQRRSRSPAQLTCLSLSETQSGYQVKSNRAMLLVDESVCMLIWLALIGLFRSRASLQAEILTLRHRLNVLRRKSPQRITFTSIDRLVFAGLYRLGPRLLGALAIVKPERAARGERA